MTRTLAFVSGCTVGFIAACWLTSSRDWADSGEVGEVLSSGTLHTEGEVPGFSTLLAQVRERNRGWT